MEIFKNTNFDFLGKKWPFIILSLILTAIGLISLAVKGGPRYGIDFRGGALMYVLFNQNPPVDKIRSVLSAQIPGEISVVNVSGSNEVIIGTEIQEEKSLNANRQKMVDLLENAFGTPGKLDVNNSGASALAERLRDPLQRAGVALSEQQVQDLAKAVMDFKNGQRSGLLRSFDELSGAAGVTGQAISVMKQECALSPFTIRQTEVVGPRVGKELQSTAVLATLYALGGMLVYIAFRFEWIYGLAAVIAVFHDTIITIGLFSIFNKEISLTVVAALLTLVGYSMNDTIVTFDRIRENLKLMRREKFEPLVNISINQTLSRTILTSGLTFLTAISLFLFGGQVLNGFAFALVVGIIVGTYSSIFIASPILIFWQNFMEARKKGAPAGPAAVKEAGAKKVVKSR
ncbi:MAG: protein translocase subunit SecF [Acidobacteria bacterium]|nr:protein translocase subunit SecF [Acidobacteriota bacterium]